MLHSYSIILLQCVTTWNFLGETTSKILFLTCLLHLLNIRRVSKILEIFLVFRWQLTFLLSDLWSLLPQRQEQPVQEPLSRVQAGESQEESKGAADSPNDVAEAVQGHLTGLHFDPGTKEDVQGGDWSAAVIGSIRNFSWKKNMCSLVCLSPHVAFASIIVNVFFSACFFCYKFATSTVFCTTCCSSTPLCQHCHFALSHLVLMCVHSPEW